MPSPILFEIENSFDLANDSFELADDNLPKDLEVGISLRKTVTRYAGSYASVQVHGEELKPIELEGTLDDTWTGSRAELFELKETIDAIVLKGELVRFEYEAIQLWGTLDASFTIKRLDRIEYRIKFEPYWRNDPRRETYIAFAEPPLDLGVNLEGTLGAFKDHIDTGIDLGIDTSFVSGMILDVLHAQNQVGNVLGFVSDIGSYADLTAEIVGLVTRSLFASVRSLDSATRKLKGAGESIVGSTAGAIIEGSQWIYKGSALSRRSLQDTLAMLRKFLERSRPIRVRLHTVGENDTLQRLAQVFLGDFARWTEIADANDLDNSALVVGSVLRIPPKF